MIVAQCDWSGEPIRDQPWPRGTAPIGSPKLLADMYPQPRDFVASETTEVGSDVEVEGDGDRARCRVLLKLSVIERLADPYCVRVYRRVRWRRAAARLTGPGMMLVGGCAAVVGFGLLGFHDVTQATADAMGLGGGGVSAIGGAVAGLGRRPRANRRESLQETVHPEWVGCRSRTRERVEEGEWRTCLDPAGSHELCGTR